jgi:hypothetical protein
MKMNITYVIMIMHADKPEDLIPLTAKTDVGAVRQIKQYVAAHPEETGYIFLSWHRKSDGCTGYLNPSVGADATGAPWNA